MNYKTLLESILGVHHDSVRRAAYAVNHALVLRNWRIGAHIVEFEQKSEDRATYGEALKKWGAIMADDSMAGFRTEYMAALNVGCVAGHDAYDPTQLATDIADFKSLAAAQGFDGTLS